MAQSGKTLLKLKSKTNTDTNTIAPALWLTSGITFQCQFALFTIGSNRLETAECNTHQSQNIYSQFAQGKYGTCITSLVSRIYNGMETKSFTCGQNGRLGQVSCSFG